MTGLNNLATLRMQAGDQRASVKPAIKAVEAGGEHARYLDTLGWAYYLSGDARNALSNLRKAVELEPDNATIRYHLGAALIAAGQQSPGREEIKRAMALDGNGQWLEDARQLLN